MRTERRWKWLSVVLTGLLGFAVAMPSAVAHTTDSVYHMVEHIYNITTSTQRTTGAIEQKVSALPDDPASTTDITEATQMLFDAVGNRGFSTVKVHTPGSCQTVVPMPPAGKARLATISIIVDVVTADTLDDEHIVTIINTDGEAGTDFVEDIFLKPAEVATLVATATPGADIEVCLSGIYPAEGAALVNAHWDDRVLVHVGE